MLEETKLEAKHILCVNWYILSKLWRKIYKEVWEQSNPDNRDKKFRLETKFPIEVTVKTMVSDHNSNNKNEVSFIAKKSVEDFNFYGLFGIKYEDYDDIMHGNDTAILSDPHIIVDRAKVFSKITHLYSTIFTGEECLIPLNDSTLPKLRKFAEARFSSVTSYDYRDERVMVDKLIQEFLYLPNMQAAIAFIKSRGEVKAEENVIERNKAFLESTRYTELLHSDISALTSYKKCLREHLEKVNSCIIYNKNKNF